MDTIADKINCPKCGCSFYVEEVLSRKYEEAMNAQLSKERIALEGEFQKKREELRSRETTLEKQKAEQETIIKAKLAEKEDEIARKLKLQIQEENKKKFDSVVEELNEQRKLNQALKDKEIELAKLQRRFDEREKDFELELLKKRSEFERELEVKIGKREQERHELKIAEKDKQLNDLRKQVEEMKRKVEQGSMQLQGEVQELAIEGILKELFPADEIREVPKGKKGADSVQIVKNAAGVECGKIIYESKRTKAFSSKWIEKLKADQLQESADIAVLVSEVLPDVKEKIMYEENVWVCDYYSFKGLALALRESLIKITAVSETQKNKGDKIVMLYDYLTGNEFRMQLEAIIGGFAELKNSIAREKLAMEKLWKEREKQLDKVLLNTTHFYGAIKGIAGSAIPTVPLLELPPTGETPGNSKGENS
ncbi:MAG: DUF2130 domain-containing protein [Planctomycetes bacterium]|nr:DUF2130 domain-containing protein [Planctomycetota bacterium]